MQQDSGKRCVASTAPYFGFGFLAVFFFVAFFFAGAFLVALVVFLAAFFLAGSTTLGNYDLRQLTEFAVQRMVKTLEKLRPAETTPNASEIQLT